MSGLSISSDDGDTAIVVGVRKANKNQQKGSTASPFRKNRDSKNTFNFDSPSVANSRGGKPRSTKVTPNHKQRYPSRNTSPPLTNGSEGSSL